MLSNHYLHFTWKKDGPTAEQVTNTISLSNDGKIKELDALIEEKEVNQVADKENIEEMKTRKSCVNNRSMDTEVVDGLELSVECASDKEEPSSESEDETNVKPRQKTIIVKVKPEKSELECTSSEEEKSNFREEIVNTPKIKSKKKNLKKKGTRINSSKVKTSGSEDGQNNDSDEDYSPRTKKQKSVIKKQVKRLTKSKKGRSETIRKSFPEKNTKCAFDDKNADTLEEEEEEEEEEAKIKNKTDEDLSENESSSSKSESEKTGENEKKSRKNTRGRRSNNVRA